MLEIPIAGFHLKPKYICTFCFKNKSQISTLSFYRFSFESQLSSRFCVSLAENSQNRGDKQQKVKKLLVGTEKQALRQLMFDPLQPQLRFSFCSVGFQRLGKKESIHQQILHRSLSFLLAKMLIPLATNSWY